MKILTKVGREAGGRLRAGVVTFFAFFGLKAILGECVYFDLTCRQSNNEKMTKEQREDDGSLKMLHPKDIFKDSYKSRDRGGRVD